MADVPLSSERIDAQVKRAQATGNAMLLHIAMLRAYVEQAEINEGRTNAYFTSILNRLIDNWEDHNG